MNQQLDLQTLAVMVLTAVGGVVPFTQWLKSRLGAKGWKALLLSAVASTIGAILTLWAGGEFLPGGAGWGNIVEVAIAVFLAAQGFYFATAKPEVVELPAAVGIEPLPDEGTDAVTSWRQDW